MEKELTSEEKQLIEREFIARQDEAFRRRRFARRAFLVGISCGITGALLRGFRLSTFASPVLMIAWLVCVMIYVGSGVFPTTFRKDMDLRWHLNPWREALQNLSESRTIAEAIALLAAPKLTGMFASFFYLALK